MPKHPYHVEDRLAHGALCSACPLNGQRKVGHDGPINVEFVAIAEAPGEDEESYGAARGEKYGRPLVGATGRIFKDNIARVGLATKIVGSHPFYPSFTDLKVHLMNVVMCRPPKNKIDSPAGKKAVRCCANSARWFINQLLAKNSDITLLPMGGTALELLLNKEASIIAYRGRVLGPSENLTLAYEPDEAILKFVLRGQKPKEEWWPHLEKLLKLILALQRRGITSAIKREMLASNPWLSEWAKLWTKQRNMLRKCVSN